MLKNEAAAYLAGVTSDDEAQANAPTNLHVLTGEVVSASDDGSVRVAIDGLMFSEEDEQSVEIETLGGLEEGDIVTILLSGENGKGMTPLAIGAQGSIDRITANIIETNEIVATKATITELNAEKARIDDLEAGNVTITGRLTAAEADIGLLEAEDARIVNLMAQKADIDAANINTATIQNAWVDKLLVQTSLISNVGNVFTLDAIQVNASSIKAGTIDVERLLVTGQDGHKYLIHVDGQGTTSYEKLDGDVIEDLTITADKLVANSITASQITTQNLVGTNGWINVANGTFSYGTTATGGNGIIWDGTNLVINGSVQIGQNQVTLPSISQTADTAAANASTALTDAANAAKTATNYIYADSNGIKIANANPSTATTYQLQTASSTDFVVGSKVRNRINSSGMTLYDGTGTDATDVVAEFGTSVTIGPYGSKQMIFDGSDGLRVHTTSLAGGQYVVGSHTTQILDNAIKMGQSSGMSTGTGSSWLQIETSTIGFPTSIDIDAAIQNNTHWIVGPSGGKRASGNQSTLLGSDYVISEDGKFDTLSVNSALYARCGIQSNSTARLHSASLVTGTTAIPYNTTLSSDTNGTGVYFKQGATDSENIGTVVSFGRSGADRKRGVRIGGHNQNNTNWNYLYLLTDKDGNRFVQVSEAAPWRTALGLGSTATMSTIPIANGGTGKTSRSDALIALGGAYGAGDSFSGTVNCGGFVTNSGKNYCFTIPLVKGIEGTLTLSSMTLIVRQDNKYVVGSASSATNVKSQATVSRTAHGLGIVVALSSAPSNVTNNSSVGIACAYSFTVS